MKTVSPPEKGSALIMTLALVVLTSILLVGFVTRMRFEVSTSRSHLDGIKAGLFAQAGMDVALGRLRGNIPVVDPAGTAKPLWLSQPGRIYSAPDSTDPLVPIELSSGAAAGDTNADISIALNSPNLLKAEQNLIAPVANPMRVNWIYIRENGDMAESVPAYDAANPVVGRFAFWTDDESTKLNLNTAHTRRSVNPEKSLSHPTKVSLDGLLADEEVAALHAYRESRHFNSQSELNRADPENEDYLAKIAAHRFSLTHYNHAPALNMFGEPRIVLTTQVSNLPEEIRNLPSAERSKYFFEILNADTSQDYVDPGIKANIDTNKYLAAVNNLIEILKRTNWPIKSSNKALADKYGAVPVEQIAMNIVDYVRARESRQQLVAQLRGYIENGEFKDPVGPPSKYFVSPQFASIARVGPRFVEAGLWVGPLSGGALPGVAKLKLYFPENGGWGGSRQPGADLPLNLPLSGLKLQLHFWLVDAAGTVYYPGFPLTETNNKPVSTYAGQQVLRAGESTVLTIPINNLLASSGLATRPARVYLRATLRTDAAAGEVSRSFDQTSFFFDNRPGVTEETVKTFGLAFDLGAPGYPANANGMTSYQLRFDDPYVGGSVFNWAAAPGANTFGEPFTPDPLHARNSIAGLEAQQDTNAAGNPTMASLMFPPPAGTPGNEEGRVGSVGELGFVHTGIHLGNTSSTTGVPFRTLRMQPQKAGSEQLPDWVMLDLFTAPPPASAATNKVLYPNKLSIGGLVNINSGIREFTDAEGNPLTHLPALKGLLSGAQKNLGGQKVTDTEAQAIAESIAQYSVGNDLASLADAGGNRGIRWGKNGDANETRLFFSPWQLIEVKGLADGGEESEELVRQVVSLATTRGGVFAIYSVGQAVRQNESGKIQVLGERRQQSLVERWERHKDTANPAAGTEVVWRTVSSRQLTSR